MNAKMAKAARRVARLVGIDDRSMYRSVDAMTEEGRRVFRFGVNNSTYHSRRSVDRLLAVRAEAKEAGDEFGEAAFQMHLRALDGELPPGTLQAAYTVQQAREYVVKADQRNFVRRTEARAEALREAAKLRAANLQDSPVTELDVPSSDVALTMESK